MPISIVADILIAHGPPFGILGEPQPESTDLHKLLTEIKNDAYGYFLDSVKGQTKLLLEA